MMFKFKTTFLPWLTFLTWLVFFTFCSAQEQPLQPVEGESDQQINEFSLSGYGDKGKKAWDLAGKSADIFTDTVKLKDVNGNLYGEKENINLTAQKGDFNKAEGKIHLEKDVVITTDSGAKLTTESLDWDRKNNIVTTKDKVNIERGNMVTQATGAVGQTALSKVELQKDVKVEITPPEDKGKEDKDKSKVIITSDGPLSIDYEKNQATFIDNVKVDRDGSQIYSDKMDIYFRKEEQNSAKEKDKDAAGGMGSKIDKIVARGNVKIVRGENVSYSDEATYSLVDRKITLSGKPKLVFYSAEDMNASFGN